MALKLRRRAEMVTNEDLLHRSGTRHPRLLRTGADSFKRVLGSVSTEVSLLGRGRIQQTDARGNEPKALLIHPDVLNLNALAGRETAKPLRIDDMTEVAPNVPGSRRVTGNDTVALLVAPILRCPYGLASAEERLGRHASRFAREIIWAFRSWHRRCLTKCA